MLYPFLLKETNKLFQNLFKTCEHLGLIRQKYIYTNIFDAHKGTEHKPSKKTVAPTNRATRVDWVKEYAHKIRVKNNAEPPALTP